MKTALSLLLLGMVSARADHDVVVYGGTSAGVTAAIQAARMGKSVILIEPSKHVGGLTTGGLGWTDSGNKAVIGGIAREFYQRVKKHYDQDSAWKFDKKSTYKTYRADEDAMWTFEPKVAEAILLDMLKEHKIEVIFNERLDRMPGKGVKKTGTGITSIAMESGKKYAGKMFIDATYEGDLMAAAGVNFTVGREANDTYKETFNGVALKYNTHNHRFTAKVSPFIKAGDPASGTLPGVERTIPADGTADHRLQAYCYRLCMSLDPNNRKPFEKPDGYDEREYELLFRNFEAGDLRFPMKPDMMPNGKTDTNNNCAVSTDYIGMNYKYPEGSYAERDAILKKHEVYQKGLMWALANHPRVPEKIRQEMAKWGLPKDEFPDTGGWPYQIYVREARRMVSDYVHTEHDCRRTRETPASVGMGSYNMDSHNCTRVVTAEGFVQNEGDVQESTRGAYRISYLSLVPKKGECPNLLVPICLSSSHIAYGSIRMEPVFMILGQSAATAACLAIDAKVSVQDLDVKKLQGRLIADKQVLSANVAPFKEVPKAATLDPAKMEGIVVDDTDAKLTGFESTSSSIGGYVGTGYRHDGDADKGKQTAVFTPKIDKAGIYEVRLYYTASTNRAKSVPVTVAYSGGTRNLKVDQSKKPEKGYAVLGEFRFDAGSTGNVTVSNKDTTGHVVIDAVQWVAVK